MADARERSRVSPCVAPKPKQALLSRLNPARKAVRSALSAAFLLALSGCWRDTSEPGTEATPLSTPPPPAWLDGPDGSRRTLPIPTVQGERNEAPDLALDDADNVWLTWVSFPQPEGQERIAVQRIADAGVADAVRQGTSLPEALLSAYSTQRLMQPVLSLGEGTGPTGWPRIAVGKDKIWVTWAEELEGRFQIRLALIRPSSGGANTTATGAGASGASPADPARLLPGPGGATAPATLQAGFGVDGTITLSESPNPSVRPVITLDPEGFPWVAWEELRPKSTAIVARKLAKDSKTVIVDATGELNLRPTLLTASDSTLWIAWDHYEEGAYDLRLRTIRGADLDPIVDLTRDRYLDQAPSLALNKGVIWLAWHSDRPFQPGTAPTTGPGTRLPAIAGRRLVLARLERDGLHFPAAGLPPVMAALPETPARLDCLEFPLLRFDGRGRAHLFARRGQGYVHQMLGPTGWTPTVDLSEKGWGGRGRELRAVLDSKGTFHLSARWLHRVGYNLLEPPALEAGVELAPDTAPAPVFELPPIQARLPEGGTGLTRTSPVPWASDTPALAASRLGLPARTSLLSGLEWYRGDIRRPPSPEAGASQGGKRGRKASVLLDPPGSSASIATAARPAGAASGSQDTSADKGIERAPQPVQLYLGDLHTHTWISDATGDPDEIFTRSRDRLKHDFVVLTDHDVSNGNRYAPSEWRYGQLLSNLFNEPGKFVTLLGYEWTSQGVAQGGFGHRNVYFPGDLAPLFGVDAEAPTTVRLFELLRGTGAFTIPHHTSWTGTDWEGADPELQPLFEVVSVHGNSERPDGAPILPRSAEGGTYAVEGLKKGLFFGFVGGSDGHGVPWHYGVSRQEDVWTTGLTGVFAPRLERPFLHQALKRRLTYATSGIPIGLWMDANGTPMGQELLLPALPAKTETQASPSSSSAPGAPVSSPQGQSSPQGVVFQIRVQGNEPLREVALLRDGEAIPGFSLDTQRGSGSGLWVEPYTNLVGDDGHVYYLRVIRDDGGMAWTSPIRIRVKGN